MQVMVVRTDPNTCTWRQVGAVNSDINASKIGTIDAGR